MTLSASTDDACDDDLDVDAVKGDVDFCRRAGATPDEVDGDDDGDVVAADLKVFCAKDGDIDFSIRTTATSASPAASASATSSTRRSAISGNFDLLPLPPETFFQTDAS